MTAKEAHKTAKTMQALKDAADQAATKAAADDRKRKMENSTKLAIEKTIPEAIQKATLEGRFATVCDIGKYASSLLVCDHFRKLGYTCSSKYYSRTVDYGDSAAPCVEHESGYEVTVSWEKS